MKAAAVFGYHRPTAAPGPLGMVAHARELKEDEALARGEEDAGDSVNNSSPAAPRRAARARAGGRTRCHQCQIVVYSIDYKSTSVSKHSPTTLSNVPGTHSVG